MIIPEEAVFLFWKIFMGGAAVLALLLIVILILLLGVALADRLIIKPAVDQLRDKE